MRAATYLSANELSLTDKAKPQVIKPTDAARQTHEETFVFRKLDS
ncbi:hypothetical protein [Streptococcus agalactiae]|nr:hypothetical protein [Streptococcus agalactiae]